MAFIPENPPNRVEKRPPALAFGSPPSADQLQCDLGDRLDALELHWGHGMWLPLPPVDPDMRLIAKALASMMTANDIKWMVLQIAAADDEAPAWLIERRWLVLEKVFKSLEK